MEKVESYWLTTFIVGAAALSATFFQFTAISLTGLAATDIATKFASLIFMAVVIERAVEVYVNNRFGDDERDATASLKTARNEIKRYKKALNDTIAVPLPAGATDAENAAAVEAKYSHIEDLKRKLKTARGDFKKALKNTSQTTRILYDKKRRAATVAAVLLSLAVALAGIRILAQFLPTFPVQRVVETAKGAQAATSAVEQYLEANLVGYQIATFHGIDIVLTSLLLAGGAEGIHQLVNGFLSSSKDPTSED